MGWDEPSNELQDEGNEASRRANPSLGTGRRRVDERRGDEMVRGGRFTWLGWRGELRMVPWLLGWGWRFPHTWTGALVVCRVSFSSAA